MNEMSWSPFFAFEFMLIGTALVVTAAVGAVIAFFKWHRKAPQDVKGRQIQLLEWMTSLLVWACVAGVGIAVLFVGLVIGGSAGGWMLALPFALVVVSGTLLGFVRLRLKRLRGS